MNYYKLSYSTDLELTADIPQVSHAEIVGVNESVDDAITYFKHPDYKPVFEGRKILDAKFTDLMSCTGLSTGKGLLVSEGFYDLAKSYYLPGCAVYPFEVYDGEKDSVIKYNYLHIINCAEMKNSINYSKSNFYIENNSGGSESISFTDWDAWWNGNLKQVEKDGRIIHADKIVLKESESRFPGLLRLPFSAVIMVSELLKDALQKNKISGISTEPANLKIITNADA